jgi:uncharacterized protein (DUF2225 family)
LYTALREYYPKAAVNAHYFIQKMQPLKMAMMKFPMDKLKYSIDDVFFAYYFALSCVEDCFIEDRILAYAKLWMRISWLYADCRDSEMEKYALGKAHTYFMQAYGFSKPDDKHLQQLMITTGVVCYKVGDKMNGLKLLAAAVTVPDGTDARKEKARELWKKYKDLPK